MPPRVKLNAEHFEVSLSVFVKVAQPPRFVIFTKKHLFFAQKHQTVLTFFGLSGIIFPILFKVG